jgi:iron-sulfur cluster repair protein YtfE (RIC family)
MNPNFSPVDLELRLLVLRYGERVVMDALARRLKLSIDEVEKAISDLEAKRAEKKVKSHSSPQNIEHLLNDIPVAKRQYVEKLIARFLSGMFLSNSRDIVDFFKVHGAKRSPRSSRKETIVPLVRMLRELQEDELQRLLETQSSSSGDTNDYLSFAQHLTGKMVDPK